MSDLTTGGINFSFERPELAIKKTDLAVKECVMSALATLKTEYNRGYADGGIKELEKIKAELFSYNNPIYEKEKIEALFDKHIAELKGKQK